MWAFMEEDEAVFDVDPAVHAEPPAHRTMLRHGKRHVCLKFVRNREFNKVYGHIREGWSGTKDLLRQEEESKRAKCEYSVGHTIQDTNDSVKDEKSLEEWYHSILCHAAAVSFLCLHSR